MAEIGIVEGVVTSCNGVLVACPHSQPVTGVFLYLKCHLTGSIALLLKRRLKQAEVVVVPFSGLDDSITHYGNTGVFEFWTELEVHLAIEDRWIICCLLEFLEEGVELSSNLSLLGLQPLLHLGLDGIDGMLDLTPTNLSLLIFRLKRHSSQQLLHEVDKHIILSFLLLEIFKSRKELVVLTSLKLNLVKHLNEYSIDASPNGLQRFRHVLFKFAKRCHHLIPGLTNRALQLLHIQCERGETLQVLCRVADD